MSIREIGEVMVDASLRPGMTGCPVAKDFHISDPDLKNPYPLFAELRETSPIVRSERFGGFWLVTTYELQRAVLKDPGTWSSVYSTIPPVQDDGARLLPLNYDPPEHTMYRTAFNPWFSPDLVARIEPAMRDRMRRLVDAFVARGEGDIIEAVAVPFPVETFLLILGLPLDDTAELLHWKDEGTRSLLSGDPDEIARVQSEIIPKVDSYFKNALKARQAETDPPQDILTFVANARVTDKRTGEREMTEWEKVETLTLFMQAGLDTVTGMMGLTLNYLLNNRKHWDQLVKDPSLIPEAVEEFMRYCSSVTMCRIATRETELGGQTIRKGEMVMMPSQSSGRDEAQYPSADTVDFGRGPIRHLGFGGGVHRCIGSHLARAELRMALEELTMSIPDMTIVEGFDPPVRFGVVGGVDELQVRTRPPA